MFTGIVQLACPIVRLADHAGGRRLTVDLDGALAGEPLAAGESVAVDGVCLTVAGIDRTRADFDVIAETLSRTMLGRRRTGDRVNVERALRAGDRLGGHIVQGHVDGVATLSRVDRSPREVKLWFDAGRDLLAGMIAKGSIAIDGVSLTLVDVESAAGRFSVALIPTTLEVTTLGQRRAGDLVNIETDMVGKWIRSYLAQMLGDGVGVTAEKLREAGFM
ncbi:MAG: Riboflavin synthase [Phycisphaerae bacterium]|nr:Riboflavin synthase [Phycisphaerae bacterium]